MQPEGRVCEVREQGLEHIGEEPRGRLRVGGLQVGDVVGVDPLAGDLGGLGSGQGGGVVVLIRERDDFRVQRECHRRVPSLSKSSEPRSEEHTSELQSLMRISYAVFCLKKKTTTHTTYTDKQTQNTTPIKCTNQHTTL